jgi:hypothetical protein
MNRLKKREYDQNYYSYYSAYYGSDGDGGTGGKTGDRVAQQPKAGKADRQAR